MASTSHWLVLVASIWLQACSGTGYLFGSISPVIKTTLDFNQKQLNRLGVAKDIGDSGGLLAGFLCDWLPPWGLILVGTLQNLIGYGWLWLIVIGRVPQPHFIVVCLLICVGTNGETFFNTAALVSSVRTFSTYRGPVVGILKGFAGLGGAIFTCVYTALYAPDQASFILLLVIGPTLVAILSMFVIRPIPYVAEDSAIQDKKFKFLYGICMILAIYLLSIIIVQDSSVKSTNLDRVFAIGLITILALPLVLVIPTTLGKDLSDPDSNFQDQVSQLRAPLLEDVEIEAAAGSKDDATTGSSGGGKIPGQSVDAQPSHFKDQDSLLFSELEDEKETWPETVRRDRLRRASSRLYRAVAEGAVKLKRKRKGPHRGEDFTLRQALVKADFWLLFFGLWCGAGSGLMVIDNLGQISQSLGYKDPHIFVALISIWNFLGRLGAGYVSEVIAREHALPRPILLATAQAVMAIGHASLAVGIPGALYAGSLLVGMGYGAHWAVAPATASELFGLKSFGLLYNFLSMAMPAGSLVFSGLIAGTLYDREAQKQEGGIAPPDVDALRCEGAVCFRVSLLIMTGVCLVGVILNVILISRTQRVYTTLYGKQRDEAADNKPRTKITTIEE
jgi:hypothetical protein